MNGRASIGCSVPRTPSRVLSRRHGVCSASPALRLSIHGNSTRERRAAPADHDFISLCKSLNRHRVRYIVVGGMAMIQQGYVRATEDIVLLLDDGPDNIAAVIDALAFLPGGAIGEMAPDDLQQYTVVRVVDVIVVDLMIRTCGISYGEAENDIEWAEVDDVNIPFASADLLIRMKQTGREQDPLDLQFLKQKGGP